MYCKNCGNKLISNNKFCSKCGIKNEAFNVNIEKNEKSIFLLSNIMVLILFVINMCLLILGIIISTFESIMNSSVGSGWFLLIVPIIVCMFVVPQFIGIIISGINLKAKSIKVLIVIFIDSIISLLTTIYSSNGIYVNNKGILFFICLFLNIILCIIFLLKIILKIKE